MINKKYFQQLKKDYQEHVSERRQIISLSNSVLHDSKRTIFSLHRGDMDNATKSIAEVEQALLELEKRFGQRRLIEEGAYSAAAEEYVEAKMFYRILTGKKVDKLEKISLDIDIILGGVSDLTGELVRLAVNKAAAGETTEVGKIKNIIDDIMTELVQFDMTGYLRTKYDQAKSNLRKIEQINYEINLRK